MNLRFSNFITLDFACKIMYMVYFSKKKKDKENPNIEVNSACSSSIGACICLTSIQFGVQI